MGCHPGILCFSIVFGKSPFGIKGAKKRTLVLKPAIRGQVWAALEGKDSRPGYRMGK